MRFKRYTSIENSYRQKAVFFIQEQFPKEEFVVQEKIHGSNFAIYVSRDDVKYAKRSGFLSADDLESFYRADRIKEDYERKALDMFNCINNMFPNLKTISIHGELFGGNYPHSDVEKYKGAVKVQNKVYYSNKNEFIVFDIKIDGEYVNFDTYVELCKQNGFMYLEALHRGSLEDCLNYEDTYTTTLPSKLGLPELENNTCEGNVIRPVKPLRLKDNSRVILKNKNSKFTEKAKKPKKFTPAKPAPEHVVQMQRDIIQYVNENRLRNVLSKVGQIDKKQFGLLQGMMVKDVVEDFIKDNEKFSELDKKERKMVQRVLGSEISNLIRPNFANIIDGNF